MREIKFRVWCENKMEPVGAIDWASGLPITCNTKTRKLYQDDDHFTLMQFTGLKDKNGKEIYEGDVVKILYTDWLSCDGCHKSPQEHMNAIADVKVVIWSVNGFYVSHKVDGYAQSMEPGRHGFIEVIGNIYENHDLLK